MYLLSLICVQYLSRLKGAKDVYVVKSVKGEKFQEYFKESIIVIFEESFLGLKKFCIKKYCETKIVQHGEIHLDYLNEKHLLFWIKLEFGPF